jgi:hypothetical protein
MPRYCYTSENGNTHEWVCPIGKAPSAIMTPDGLAKRDLRAEHIGVPSKAGWPITCVASGVNAADSDKLRKHLADKGVPTEVTPGGDPVYRDPAHRRRALKARGFIDKASYS